MFLTPRRRAVLRRHLFSEAARATACPAFPDLLRARSRRSGARSAPRSRAQNAAGAATRFARTLPRRPRGAATSSRPTSIAAMLDNLRASFDAQHGGFGGAPKFPHPDRARALPARRGEQRRSRVVTLDAHGEGGIYDQLGGGFCRYSVDAHWTIPHFEKMLYDNGPLLAPATPTPGCVTREPLYARCAAETAGWMHARDAVARRRLLLLARRRQRARGRQVLRLGPRRSRRAADADEYAAFAPRFGLDRPPNFEGQHWHLRIVAPLARRRATRRCVESARAQALRRAREARAARARREDPRLAGTRSRSAAWRTPGASSARAGLARVRAPRARFHPHARCGATAGCSPPTRTAARTSTRISTTTPSCSPRCSSCCRREFSTRRPRSSRSRSPTCCSSEFEDARAAASSSPRAITSSSIHRPKPRPRQRDALGQRGGGLGASARLAALTGEMRYAQRRGAHRSRSSTRRCATTRRASPPWRSRSTEQLAAAATLDPARPRARRCARWQRRAGARVPAGRSPVLAVPDGTRRAAAVARQAGAVRSLSTHGCAGALLASRRSAISYN